MTWAGHFIAKRGNGSEEIAGGCQDNSLCLLRALYLKFRIQKHCLVKHFAFLKNVCNQYLNFMLQLTYRCWFFFFFTSCWLPHNRLSWNVWLFCCNRIGQLCRSCPAPVTVVTVWEGQFMLSILVNPLKLTVLSLEVQIQKS